MYEAEITVYGAPWCPDCRQAKRFLGEQRVPYRWVDIDQDPDGRQYVQQVNDGRQIIPTIVFGDGSTLVEPTNAELAAKLGINPKAKQTFYDLITVGGGPTGLTTAIYAAREGMDALVIERAGVGGQAGVTERIDNYPGFSQGVGGARLADEIKAQAERFGVEILAAQAVSEIAAAGDYRMVTTEADDQYCARTLLIATGSRYRRLNAPGEDDFIGAGVHFCATCDGPFYKDREMVVVGGGNSGLEEGLFLTKFASKVTILEVRDRLGASRILQDKVAGHDRMDVRVNTTVQEFKGNGHLESVVVRDVNTGAVDELTTGAVFIFIGMDPNTEILGGSVALDRWGFVKTGETLETSMDGVFAAGDVRAGSTKQLASAVGEGATAALMIRQYLEKTEGSRGYRGD